MKKQTKPTPFIFPIPIVLLGVKTESKNNFTTIGDIAVAGLNPPLITVSLHKNHYSTQYVRKNKIFSINLPTQDMLAEVDYCGMVSGRDVDKSSLFIISVSETYPQAPLIDSCPVNLVCEVLEEVQIENRCIFVAKVLKTYLDEDLKEKNLDQMQVISYGMDNGYYTAGPLTGMGYHAGKSLIKGSPDQT